RIPVPPTLSLFPYTTLFRSLYVGIPFCPTRCAYCSFISAAGSANRLIPQYLEALLTEIDAAGAAARQAGKTVRAVYIGGGTPTRSEEHTSELQSRFDLVCRL